MSAGVSSGGWGFGMVSIPAGGTSHLALYGLETGVTLLICSSRDVPHKLVFPYYTLLEQMVH